MTWGGRLIALFPASIVALFLASVVGIARASCFSHSLAALFIALSVLFIVPPGAYRIHNRIWPLKSGGSRLVGKGYSPWFGGHQIQLVYFAFPWLESGLRLVPGLYSAWLRLWGSKVGRSVYWTPAVEISDRALMEIGDHVVFGHRVVVFGHVIKPRRGNMLLVVKRVSIGDGAFIGAGVVLAPGAVVAAGAFVEAGTHVYPNERVEAEEHVQAEAP